MNASKFAEKAQVSRNTVSRWSIPGNCPVVVDWLLDSLIEIEDLKKKLSECEMAVKVVKKLV